MQMWHAAADCSKREQWQHGRVNPTQQEGTIQLFAAAKCHVTPSWVNRSMKQIKRLKSLLQRRESVRVYKMADGTDSESQMYVLFCYFA